VPATATIGRRRRDEELPAIFSLLNLTALFSTGGRAAGDPSLPTASCRFSPPETSPTAMHRRRRSNKNAQTARFSLLLLEDGELFLDVGLATL
jgi:hypothetical protein